MNNYKFVGTRPICTRTGIIVATSFSRIVLGDRGAYVEFLTIKKEALHIPPSQRWRTQGLSSLSAYYIEYRTEDNVKVYFQQRRVGYADYVPRRYYISPVFLKDFIRA